MLGSIVSYLLLGNGELEKWLPNFGTGNIWTVKFLAGVGKIRDWN